MLILRKFKISLTIISASILGLVLWSLVIEPSRLVIHSETLQIRIWQTEHNGIKIALLTDLHVGSPHTGLDKIKKVVELTNTEKPDLIVITGDFMIQGVIGGKFVEPEPIAEVLRDLHAPLGVVSVLGNHDWWYDGVRITNALRSAGIIVLENQSVKIDFNGKPFWIAGIADKWTRSPNIIGTLRNIPDDDPVILITHNPDIFPGVPSRVSLTIAGHTHGGQVAIPFLGRPVVPSIYKDKYAAGHIIEDGRHLFVGTGIGTSIYPVRFRVPPEIVILTLGNGQD
jgi:predicted MPP superfamily phosphohydrolase